MVKPTPDSDDRRARKLLRRLRVGSRTIGRTNRQSRLFPGLSDAELLSEFIGVVFKLSWCGSVTSSRVPNIEDIAFIQLLLEGQPSLMDELSSEIIGTLEDEGVLPLPLPGSEVGTQEDCEPFNVNNLI